MDKLLIKETTYDIDLLFRNNPIFLKYFSDIHMSDKSDEKKLYIILDKLLDSKVDYICIGGDLLDLTNYFSDNKTNRKIIINWLKELSLYYKTIVSLGNHDFLRKENNGYRYEYLKDFWEEINSIDNIYLSHFNTLYEDDNVFIYMPELDYRYYENYNKDEDLYYLLKKINTDKDIITNLDPHKIKIMMIHSPYLLQNEDVLKLISEFDIVLSGHMHNGLVLPVLDELIKNNKGITTPTGKLFKDNCRGYKNVYVNGKYVRFIMSGGITKLSKNSGFLSHFNGLYPACIENINIKTKKYTN